MTVELPDMSGVSGEALNSLGGVEPAAAETGGENPQWAEALNKFPEGVRGIAREQFADWDAKVNGRFEQIHEQYKPLKAYESFATGNISADELQQAHGFAQLLKSDPEGVTRALAENLGLSFAEAANVVAEAVEAEAAPNAELESIRQAQAQLQQTFEQQEQQRAFQQEEVRQTQNLETEIKQVEATYGKMSPEVLNEVLRRAHANSLQTNAPVSILDAYKELEAFVGTVQRSTPRPGAMAPRTIPTGNGVPITPPTKSLGQMTSKEAREYAGQIVARSIAGQN